MSLDQMILVKPKAYEAMGKQATEERIKAGQRVIKTIKKGIIDRGEAQIKAKSGYSQNNLPNENPTRTPEFKLDEIEFGLKTTVQVVNPEYVVVYSKIQGFLEDVFDDWNEGVRKDGIRTYELQVMKDSQENSIKSPFIKWDYLMSRALKKISRETVLDTITEIETINPPEEYETMELSKLVIPITQTKGFDIFQPGNAKVWYLAKRFHDEVVQETVEPVKKEMEKRAEGTNKYQEQFENWLYNVESIDSPRRQLGKAINLLFTIPQKDKPKGSTALPIVPNHENFIELLEEYKLTLPTSLQKWKKKGELNYEGKIGEMITFFYGLENDERMLSQFPFLPEYQVKRDGDKMFISVQALYNRMKALEKNYVSNRLLKKHTIEHIV